METKLGEMISELNSASRRQKKEKLFLYKYSFGTNNTVRDNDQCLTLFSNVVSIQTYAKWKR